MEGVSRVRRSEGSALARHREVLPGCLPPPGLCRPAGGAIAPQLVSEVKAAGMIVVLATNAIFPEVVYFLERMRWGELDPNLFDLITCYETMHAAKPNPLFYREILERLGVAPCDAVMVGNDPELDMRVAKRRVFRRISSTT